VNLNIKVSKTLTHWFLLLSSFRFCDTQYLHFTTRVFGHRAITPFLGGFEDWVSYTWDSRLKGKRGKRKEKRDCTRKGVFQRLGFLYTRLETERKKRKKKRKKRLYAESSLSKTGFLIHETRDWKEKEKKEKKKEIVRRKESFEDWVSCTWDSRLTKGRGQGAVLSCVFFLLLIISLTSHALDTLGASLLRWANSSQGKCAFHKMCISYTRTVQTQRPMGVIAEGIPRGCQGE